MVPMVPMIALLAAAQPKAACPAQQTSDGGNNVEAICEAFCSGACSMLNTSDSAAGRSGAPKTTVMYRMTPRNCTTMTNKDTGDARGDISFVLSQRSWHSSFLANVTSNVVAKFEIAGDGGWGPYKQCNPMHGWDTSHFACEFDCMHPPHCSGQDKNGTGFGGVFCGCERANKTVGRMDMGAMHFHHSGPLPDKCGWSYDPLDAGTCMKCSTPRATVTGANESDVLSNLCGACADDDGCVSWTTFDNSTGMTYGADAAEVAGACISAKKRPGHHSWLGVGGEWYSNPAEGECKKDQTPGDGSGCTWKLEQIVKYTNETCVLDRVNSAVELYGKACFGACPGARNTSSDCFGECYTSTVAGDWYKKIKPMPVPLLVGAWEGAFSSDDPETGACPHSTSKSPTGIEVSQPSSS